MSSQSPVPPDVVKSEEPAVDETAVEDPIVKTESNNATSTVLSAELLKMMKGIVDYLTDYKDETGHEVASLFQRMLNKRLIPDYFDVIKEPTAFSTIRGKLLRKQYKDFDEFVRDFALISHNAQVYNRPSAPVYSDAIALRELFKLELRKLVEKKMITEADAALPDLGEIPPVEDSPPPGPEDEEAEDDEDDDDEDEEEDDSDDDGARRTRRRRGRPSAAALAKREGSKIDDDAKDDPDSHKKRGRPPKVHTPMEARINAVLKGLRKFKNPGGDLKILHFEKLPDKTVMPEYYYEIKTPIAMDLIKRKAKRKKYQSVDQAMKDLELMFENAKAYNLEDSQVYRDAVDLQKEARILAEQEKKKPDGDYVDEDGRLPLPEILHNGEIWKVGDWVHLQNPNDLTKPIVAQIYRTWQDPEGQKWINACWYYRPEQTVHRYEKHFFENEVVKTGQYRDHHIDEVVDRCFVMFFTRFHKGRPRGFPADKEVYVCEARYNEDKFKLNKIKTWASCVPDEVRETDYEMDLFNTPRKMKKIPSPIKHLLREDAKEDDPLPKPTWGALNAPPIVGAVHRRPRESNESPPPEPTPSPSPEPAPEPARQSMTNERPGSYGGQTDGGMATNSSHVPRSPVSAQHQTQNSYGQQFATSRPAASPAPALLHHNSYSSHTGAHPTPVPLTPQATPHATYSSHYASTSALPPTTLQQNSQTPNPLGTYDGYRTSGATSVHRSSIPITSSTSANAYNPPRPIEVYRLSDTANASIPPDIRAQFHRDEQDHILFFTAPPLDVPRIPGAAQKLGHSIKYLAAKARERNASSAAQPADHCSPPTSPPTATTTNPALKRKTHPDPDSHAATAATDDNGIPRLKSRALQALGAQINAGTEKIYRDMYGPEPEYEWRHVMRAEQERLGAVQAAEAARRERVVRNEREREARKRIWLGGAAEAGVNANANANAAVVAAALVAVVTDEEGF